MRVGTLSISSQRKSRPCPTGTQSSERGQGRKGSWISETTHIFSGGLDPFSGLLYGKRRISLEWSMRTTLDEVVDDSVVDFRIVGLIVPSCVITLRLDLRLEEPQIVHRDVKGVSTEVAEALIPILRYAREGICVCPTSQTSDWFDGG
ncbi:hypothetical protein HWI79_1167 [Cryptosporidium felis]|nr:hypothetical protein HWI79_1167 [Cryptosporidium felis]